jgi:hypothetical protein
VAIINTCWRFIRDFRFKISRDQFVDKEI